MRYLTRKDYMNRCTVLGHRWSLYAGYDKARIHQTAHCLRCLKTYKEVKQMQKEEWEGMMKSIHAVNEKFKKIQEGEEPNIGDIQMEREQEALRRDESIMLNQFNKD